MFSKFKTTTLAVITAAATLLGSGQASAYTIGGNVTTHSNIAVGPFPAVCGSVAQMV